MRFCAFLLAALLSACSRERKDREYSGVVETREIQIGSKVGGRVREVYGVEGQRVGGGDVLVRFDAEELQAAREQLLARIAQAEADATRLNRGYRVEEVRQAQANADREQASLQALKAGPRPEEIEQAQADYEALKAEGSNAQRSFERIEALHRSGDLSAQARDDARARQDSAEKRVEGARQRLELLRAGTRKEDIRAGEARYRQALANAQMFKRGFRPEEIEEGKARVREAKALLAETEVRLREAEVRAPETCGKQGCLLEVIGVRPGDLIPGGKAIATLLEPAQLWVRIYVPEPELGSVVPGQKASVQVDTFPGRIFRGSIEQIAARAEFLPRNVQTRDDRNHQVFGVKVNVENTSGLLKSGMAATVRVEGSAQ